MTRIGAPALPSVAVVASAGAAAIVLLVAFRLRPAAAARVVSRPAPTAGPRPRARVALVVLALAALALIDVASAAAVALAGAAWSATHARRRAARLRREVESAMPEVLDLVVVCLEAGHLPLEVMRVLRPVLPAAIGDAFAEVVGRVERGLRFADALAALPELLGPPSLTFVDVLVQTDRAGLAYGPAIERIADDARQHRRRLAEASARELPVRLAFPLVLCTLPSFVLVAIVPLLVGALSSVRVG